MDNKISPERKKTNLDRGFPVGKILLVMLGAVVFLQTLSAWKIMNLEKEKAILEAEKQNFTLLKKRIPEMQAIAGELANKLQELKNELTIAEKQRIQVSDELKQNEQMSNHLKEQNSSTEISIKNNEKIIAEQKTVIDAASGEKSKLDRDNESIKSYLKRQNEVKLDLDEEVQKLEAQQRDLNSKNAGIQARIDELDKLNKSNSNLAEITRNIKSITDKNESNYRDMCKNLENAIANFNNAASNIEDITKKYKDKASLFDSLADNVKESITGLREEAVKYQLKQQELTEIHNRIKDVLEKSGANLEGVSTNDARLRASMESLKSEVDKTIIKLKEVQNLNLQFKDDIEKIYKTVDSLKEEVNKKTDKQ